MIIISNSTLTMGPTPVLKNQKLFHTNQFFFIVLRRLHIVRVVVLISAADDTFEFFVVLPTPRCIILLLFQYNN